MRSLVLDKGDGELFERIYAIATQLADPDKANALRRSDDASSQQAVSWQKAFEELGENDRILTSAILQAVGAPFGAYVLTTKTSDRLEITPWLLANNNKLDEAVESIKSEDCDADSLYSFARSVSLTADFLAWLNNRSNTAKRR